jgi:hypothetical protein
MPFGLTSAPATFQTLMNTVLTEFLRKFALVSFDDILIYITSFFEHVIHLRTVLQVLRENKLYAIKSKCFFAQSEVEYLGHIICDKGVVLTMYYGTPRMFITLWFGFDYGTNPPLGTLII